MKVILISQKNEFDSEHIAKIEKFASTRWINSEKTDLMEVPELFDNDEIILAFSPVPMGWKIPDEIYNKLNNIKAVSLVTTSYDFLDVPKLNELTIPVTNVPYYSSNAVAEYALFMLMALLKRFALQVKSDFKYEFTEANLMDEFGDKTVGIIGLGHVGEKIARLTKKLGFKVAYYSKNTRNIDYDYVSFEKLITDSDIIFPAFVINESTKKLLTSDVLSKLKNSAYFVNIVGEDSCDIEYLLKRVEMGKLQGLAFESDKRKIKDYKDNIFISAPFAWYTKQSLKHNIDIWTDTIISCIKGKPQNRVA